MQSPVEPGWESISHFWAALVEHSFHCLASSVILQRLPSHVHPGLESPPTSTAWPDSRRSCSLQNESPKQAFKIFCWCQLLLQLEHLRCCSQAFYHLLCASVAGSLLSQSHSCIASVQHFLISRAKRAVSPAERLLHVKNGVKWLHTG